MDKSELLYEHVTERIGHRVLASTIRPATSEEVEAAKKLHAEGLCSHNIVQDTYGWPYDFRDCATCGTGLGTV